MTVRKVDDFSVEFVLTEPYAPFLDYTTVGVLPEHRLAGIAAAELPQIAFNREPIGTGPFRLTDVELGEGHIGAVTLRRFPRYYGRSGYLENVILRFYPSYRAAFEAYQMGRWKAYRAFPLTCSPRRGLNLAYASIRPQPRWPSSISTNWLPIHCRLVTCGRPLCLD